MNLAESCLVCWAQYNWYWQSITIHCNMYFCACNSLEPVVSDYVSPFLAGMLDESTDIFCSCILPDWWADFIAPDRIFCHTLFCCQFCSLRCAVDLLPYLFGISSHLQPVTRTNIIPLMVWQSSCLGLPVLAGDGRCFCIVSHCLSEISWNCMEFLPASIQIDPRWSSKIH